MWGIFDVPAGVLAAAGMRTCARSLPILLSHFTVISGVYGSGGTASPATNRRIL